MHVGKHFKPAGSAFKTVSFTGQVTRLLESERFAGTSRPATLDEISSCIASAREQLGVIAAPKIVFAVRNHNPAAFRIIDFRSSAPGFAFFSYLPLNAPGVFALLNGAFDVNAPSLQQLCRAGEQPEALYVWCVLAPGRFIAGLAAIASHFDDIAPEGCPIFITPATPQAARMFPKMGFMTAYETFPNIGKKILVVFPTRAEPACDTSNAPSAKSKIVLRIARSSDDMLKVFAVRAATYMSEQECPFDEEYDGNDFCAAHMLGEVDGEPAGCIRIRYFGDFVKLERLAVRHEFRNSRLAFRLVRAAMDFCSRKGFRRVYGHSRSDLVRFWETFGFRRIPDRPAFTFSNVEYVEMAGDIDPAGDPICERQDPLYLIRPEGEWDKPGPLDLSAARTPRTAAQLRSRIRHIVKA